MKIPLRFQITEFDCGTTSLLNVLAYLYEREELPAVLLKEIFKHTLDLNDNLKLGEGGTSKNSIRNLVNYIERYSKQENFDLNSTKLINSEITEDKLRNCINNNGCILIRCYLLKTEHYILITNIKKNNVYIFDPYYLDKKYKSSNVKLVFNKPFTHNRKISIKRLMSTKTNDFSLGPIDNRDCVLFTRNND